MKDKNYIRLFATMSMLIFACEANSMEVEPPELSHYQDASGTVKLEIPGPFSKKKPKVTVINSATGPASKKETSYVWKATQIPSEVRISPQAKMIILLGGLGDSGSDLGLVEIRSYSGETLKTIKLEQNIPKMEKMSQEFGLNMGNFPWIEDAKLAVDGQSITINVCDKKKVTISFADFSIKITALK
jgi:hypothetical protein